METSKSEGLALQYNKLAMDHLHAARPAEALTLLLKAESLVKSLPESQAQGKLRAITLNNLGCFYKRAAQPQKALDYLEAALDLSGTETHDHTNLAGTHLNICAIKSQMGDHQEALMHAQAALHLLASASLTPSPNMLTTLVVAHHNAGVELEYLQQGQKAVEQYREGFETARENLGPAHPLTTSLQSSYFQALEGLERHSLGTKGKRSGKYISISPVPPPSEGFRRKPPRRSASKDATDYFPKSTSPRSSHLSRSFDETQDSRSWGEYGSSPEHRVRAKPASQPRQWTLGTPLQPLHTIAPPSKQSRRDKSFSAPNKVKPPLQWAPGHSSRSTKFRRSPQNDDSKLSTVVKTLSEKLTRLEEKVEEMPRKGRMLQVVKANSEQILSSYRGDFKDLVFACKIHRARKQLKSLQSKYDPRASAELRAQAAINAFEQLKRVALQEVQGLTSLPKPAVKPTRKHYFAHNKTRSLAPIPEARIESKSDHRIVCIIRIQAWFRMLIARKDFIRIRKSVVILQKWVRAMETRRLYQAIRCAVEVIQRWWRARRATRM